MLKGGGGGVPRVGGWLKQEGSNEMEKMEQGTGKQDGGSVC